ncbi:MAG: hypothetical protein ABIH82_03930 [Candidatus Woesearchaeota archaeon]
MEDKYGFEPIGRPTKVKYKGVWRKIYWKPLVIINGKPLLLEDMFQGISSRNQNILKRKKK